MFCCHCSTIIYHTSCTRLCSVEFHTDKIPLNSIVWVINEQKLLCQNIYTRKKSQHQSETFSDFIDQSLDEHCYVMLCASRIALHYTVPTQHHDLMDNFQWCISQNACIYVIQERETQKASKIESNKFDFHTVTTNNKLNPLSTAKISYHIRITTPRGSKSCSKVLLIMQQSSARSSSSSSILLLYVFALLSISWWYYPTLRSLWSSSSRSWKDTF